MQSEVKLMTKVFIYVRCYDSCYFVLIVIKLFLLSINKNIILLTKIFNVCWFVRIICRNVLRLFPFIDILKRKLIMLSIEYFLYYLMRLHWFYKNVAHINY